jgi:hypothetical protein
MKKKNNISPRKRKRLIKKLFFVSLLSLVIIVAFGIAGYFTLIVQLRKPAYISPLPNMKQAQASGQDTTLMSIKKRLDRDTIAYSSIKQEQGGSYKLTLQKGGEVMISSKKDLGLQIASLQYILSRLTMEGKLFSQLDLRFDKPVIRLR